MELSKDMGTGRQRSCRATLENAILDEREELFRGRTANDTSQISSAAFTKASRGVESIITFLKLYNEILEICSLYTNK